MQNAEDRKQKAEGRRLLTAYCLLPTAYWKSGFTLVELLVVATIFSILAVGMASSFISGMRLWDRAQHQDTARTNALLALEVMARELRQGVEISAAKWHGSAHEVSFPTVVGGSLVNITYLYEGYEKRLRRREVSLKEILEEKLEPTSRDTVLVSRADDLSIEFASFDKQKEKAEYEWTDEWKEENGVPVAIRLTLTVKHEKLTKTVFFPLL